MCDNTMVMEACSPIAKGASPLSDHEIGHLLTHVDDWQIIDDHLEKTYRFEDHYQTMAFVNAVAWISHREDHHPEMVVGPGACTLRFATHAVDGLSRNDFLCAAKADHLVES